jgi:acetyl-CoA synthetase
MSNPTSNPDSTPASNLGSTPTIESILHEDRLFQPPAELAAQAKFKSFSDYEAIYAKAKADPAAFWGELAQQELHWFEPWKQVLDWQPPFAKWFEGGKINISYNCLDRHLTTWRKTKPRSSGRANRVTLAPSPTPSFTVKSAKAANVLKDLGVQKGDRVGIYMPMVPEAAIAMLACARIGAPHSVVFGGFSAEALRDRLVDGEAKLVITADGGFRKDKTIP